MTRNPRTPANVVTSPTVPTSPTTANPARLLAIGLVGLSLFGTACGDADASASMSVDGAWARTSPMNVDAGAAYFSITSDEATTLVSASVAAEVAATVELHEVVMAEMAEMAEMEHDGDDDMDHQDHGDHEGHGDMDEMEGHEGHDHGAMKMQEIEDGIELGAGETVELAPGGLHVMLLDLPDPLELGETFDLTLTFADGETTVVEVEVRDEAP